MPSPSWRPEQPRSARWPDTRRPDRGSITAEFAAVLPAVVVMLVFCLVSLQLAGLQLRLQDAAADASRSLSRGDSRSLALSRLSQMVPHASLTVAHQGDLLCVTASSVPASGGAQFMGITLRATGCALDAGR